MSAVSAVPAAEDGVQYLGIAVEHKEKKRDSKITMLTRKVQVLKALFPRRSRISHMIMFLSRSLSRSYCAIKRFLMFCYGVSFMKSVLPACVILSPTLTVRLDIVNQMSHVRVSLLTQVEYSKVCKAR